MKNKNQHDPKYISVKNVCFSLIDKKDKREKKFAKQRLSRGFDDSETWSLRDTIANFILPRLKRFKKVQRAFPADITAEEWDSIIDKMIISFEMVKRDKWDVDLSKAREQLKKIDEGLNLFAKWYLDLWW